MSAIQDNITGDQVLLFPGDVLIADPLVRAGQLANQYAGRDAFVDYQARISVNTLRAQINSLAHLADYLTDLGIQVGDLQLDPQAWHGMTYGLIVGFRRWLLERGYAVGSINLHLTTIRVYSRLAAETGAISAEDHILIAGVKGYSRKEAQRVDDRREVTRRGRKKSEHISFSLDQARRLKRQPDTPQGRRDTLMMCLLLDHGLRVGEVAALRVDDFDLKAGEMHFYRPKVSKVQTHQLTEDTSAALERWFSRRDAPTRPFAPILRASRRGGELDKAGMSERAITKRVGDLAAQIGMEGVSAHDCRHFWATHWAEDGIDLIRLQEAGGWSSLAMPRRYIEEARIANEGMGSI